MREWDLLLVAWVIPEVLCSPSGVMAAPISELTKDGSSQHMS